MRDWQQTAIVDSQIYVDRKMVIPPQGESVSASDWQKITLERLFSADNSKLGEHAEEPTVMSLSKYDGFVRAHDYFDKRIASEKLDGYKTVEPGGWAYSTIHIDEGSIARNTLGETGVISPMYTTLRWHGGGVALPEYAELLLRSPRMLAEYANNAQGSVNRRRSLPFKAFRAIPITVPPLSVQERIVEVIDVVDRQIAALNEEAEALDRVSVAVAEDMLAEEPTVALGTMLDDIRGGKSPQANNRPPDADELGVLKVSAVTPFVFLPEESKSLLPGTSMPESALVQPGDVLITRANTPLRVGAVARVPADVRYGLYLADKTLRLVPSSGLESDFLVVAMALKLARSHLASSATGTSASMVNISQDRIRDTPIPLADLDRQREVSSAVLSVRANADAVRTEAARLRNARSSLLSGLLERTIEIDSAELEV